MAIAFEPLAGDGTDRLAQIRRAYRDERTTHEERLRLSRECLTLLENLRETVEAKRAALETFLADLDVRLGKVRDFLASELQNAEQGVSRRL